MTFSFRYTFCSIKTMISLTFHFEISKRSVAHGMVLILCIMEFLSLFSDFTVFPYSLALFLTRYFGQKSCNCLAPNILTKKFYLEFFEVRYRNILPSLTISKNNIIKIKCQKWAIFVWKWVILLRGQNYTPREE